ncbi:interleukin-5 receptor subunit alpha-like [Hoplias malabaricus]|uniref:interleukin-5 receptor subunit alpha-like n=1 Tax=Hoplias malabaricus TaxID=27720 RepID=UPI0034623871
MKIYGVLFIVTLVLVYVTGDECPETCFGIETPLLREGAFIVYEKDADGFSNRTCEIFDMLPGFGDYEDNLTCSISKSSQISCSWITHALPKDAQHSASYQLRGYGYHSSIYHFSCSLNSEKQRVECYGQINASEYALVQVNISTSSHWLLICQLFQLGVIEILDPPEIGSVLINATELEIKWSLPKSSGSKDKSDCFEYELKINDEVIHILPNKNLTYTKQNIDLARSYIVQIRTKMHYSCHISEQWSDWSKAKVVNPVENPYKLNVHVILCIAFVLPMILLALLLLCKFQRLSDKLFPSIPSPSLKVKTLLEKGNFIQDPTLKHPEAGYEVDYGTEILEVTG